jgi:hypothetical protein
MASRQRWYCRDYQARYKPSRDGVLAEFIVDGKAYYLKGDVPGFHMSDAKMLMVQERFRASTPEELFAMIPRAEPLARGQCFVPFCDGATGQVIEGVFKFAAASYRALPPLDWANVYSWALAEQQTPLLPGSARWQEVAGTAPADQCSTQPPATAAGDDDLDWDGTESASSDDPWQDPSRSPAPSGSSK